MAKYLITGIAGFIGSSLARAVLTQRNEVRGIDNFSTGRKENIAEIVGDIDFREADLLDLDAVKDACRGVDYVLHQAAIPSVPRSVRNPIESNQANVDATVNVLVAARDAGVKRVVYAASSSVYGDSPAMPKREEMVPDPISPYAVGKLAGEHYMKAFYRCYGLETVCLRYFNILGRGRIPILLTRACLPNLLPKCWQKSNPPSMGMASRAAILPLWKTRLRPIYWHANRPRRKLQGGFLILPPVGESL